MRKLSSANVSSVWEKVWINSSRRVIRDENLQFSIVGSREMVVGAYSNIGSMFVQFKGIIEGSAPSRELVFDSITNSLHIKGIIWLSSGSLWHKKPKSHEEPDNNQKKFPNVLRTEQKKGQILSWLSEIEYIKHHWNALEGILDGTGHWLLGKREFREWRTSKVSSILWLHGIRKELPSVFRITKVSSSNLP